MKILLIKNRNNSCGAKMEDSRILIVDDDISTTTILNKILSNRGFIPTVCHNGIEALDDRITSYNVCYTKLLRGLLFPLEVQEVLFH